MSLYLGSDTYGTDAAAGGGGGSNFIAGHTDCQAIEDITADESTGEYIVQSAANSIYVAVSGPSGRPVPGASPNLQGIQFYDTAMNVYYAVGTPDDLAYEPDPNDEHLNTGNGKVVITFMGGTQP